MNEYVIYGKPSCSYCERAKQILTQYDLQYEYVDLSLDEGSLEKFMSKGFRTVPVIYYKDVLIGGYEELQHHLVDKLL